MAGAVLLSAFWVWSDNLKQMFFGADKEAMMDDGSGAGTSDTDIGAEKEQDIRPAPEQESSEAEEDTQERLPSAAAIDGVPFISQSPFGDWADPRQQHGCEEASLLMAYHWISGEVVTKEEALGEIFAMSAFEDEHYGPGTYDLSIADTLKFYREYYGYEKSFTRYDISADDIKREIAAGNLVILPMNGVDLGNPHFTAPGPERHELVVVGYDDAAGEFITHDPGTRWGENYHYDYDIFMGAIRDYETGFDEPIVKEATAMLVIEKE